MIFWDLFGEQGHPIRATVSEMGPLLLSRLMDLTEAQEGVHEHRLQDRRRGRPAAARHEGSAVAARQHRRARRRDLGPLRQCHQAFGRRHPAHAPGARAAGRQRLLRRAGARHRRSHAHHARRARRDLDPGGRQADDVPAALRDLPAVADVGTVRGTARGRRSGASRSWCSSSTRPTFCSTKRRRR